MRKASEVTAQFYAHGGDLLLLAAARRAGPSFKLMQPDEKLLALASHLGASTTVLAAGTVCVYRQYVRAAIKHLVEIGADASLAETVKANLLSALDEREGQPEPQRGSSLKIDVPTIEELAHTFELLKSRFFQHSGVLDLTLMLYILLVPRLGIRPIEVTSARREGAALIVRTAKRRGHSEREIPLKNWPDEYVLALDVLLALVPRELDARNFRLWRNALASRLARASLHSCKKRRLALYCCRHIAFANWRDIGMSPEEIQRLAGHAALASQKNYAKGKKGFGRAWMFNAVSSLDADAGTSRPNIKTADFAATEASEKPAQTPKTKSPSKVVAPPISSPVKAGVRKTDQSTPQPSSSGASSQSPSTPSQDGLRADTFISQGFVPAKMPVPAQRPGTSKPFLDGNATFRHKAEMIAGEIERLLQRGKPLAGRRGHGVGASEGEEKRSSRVERHFGEP